MQHLINRLFVLTFKNEDEDINDRFSFSKYFIPNAENKRIQYINQWQKLFLMCQ